MRGDSDDGPPMKLFDERKERKNLRESLRLRRKRNLKVVERGAYFAANRLILGDISDRVKR